MAFMDLFKASDYKQQVEQLTERVKELESQLTPEMQEADSIQQRIKALESEEERERDTIATAKRLAEQYRAKADRLQQKADELKKQIVTFEDAILVQDFGLYEPRFDFANSSQYKYRLQDCRARQREEIKELNKHASETQWTVNGSKAEGRKMVRQLTRLIMRAYNGECDEIVRKVKTTNVNKSISQVYDTAESIDKLGEVIGLTIPDYYRKLKEEEVRLAYEFAMQKEQEKEALREAREQEREERKLQQEIAAARKKLEKERKQYLTAYKDIAARLKEASEEDKAALEAKAEELKAKLEDVDAAVADVDYREANQRAGFVYVISNIGSFGEGVYKIGMTRRLDPMERVRELGDASVPFNFDVHAMIFCDDAPKLEASLHKRFEDRKVNIVNQRREFFRVTLQEIEEVVKENYDKTVEFQETPDADQYRTSEELRKRGIYHC